MAKAKAPASKAKKVAPIPARFHSLTPYLTVRDANAAIEFYKRAFGAKEVFRHATPDGKIGHAEVQIGDSVMMLSDEFPGMCSAPQGPVPAGLYLYVENVDKIFDQSVKAGAKVKVPVSDQFWGDRIGSFVDPFGHSWTVATHVRDVSPKEMEKGAAEHMKQQVHKAQKETAGAVS